MQFAKNRALVTNYVIDFYCVISAAEVDQFDLAYGAAQETGA